MVFTLYKTARPWNVQPKAGLSCAASGVAGSSRMTATWTHSNTALIHSLVTQSATYVF